MGELHLAGRRQFIVPRIVNTVVVVSRDSGLTPPNLARNQAPGT
jgi:hypothetical protein